MQIESIEIQTWKSDSLLPEIGENRSGVTARVLEQFSFTDTKNLVGECLPSRGEKFL